RIRGGRGGDAGDRAAAGLEGPGVVSWRAQHRSPGSGRHFHDAHPRRSRAHGLSGEMSERELRGLTASGGVAIGRALVWLDEEPAAAGEGDPLAALDTVAAELARGAERFRAAGL